MKVEKAYEITDARIQFVSLVDKAANKRTFLMTKQEDGQASFTTYGKIVKADADSHFVTGIVYEPMTEDSDGNFMTEDEITKACHWFAKNGNKVDLQHSFDPLDNAHVVESWIAKSDYDIDGTPVKKGTWLMTVEVQDDAIWDAIQKGEITGFSMGGLGNYSEEDVELEKQDRKGLLKQIASALGFNVVTKGKVTEIYEERMKAEQFWNAFDSLKAVLQHWDSAEDATVYETDESVIREALEDFGAIITELLTEEEPIAKSLYQARPKAAVGANMRDSDKEELQGIYKSLGEFITAMDVSKAKPAEEDDPEDKKDEESEEPDEGDPEDVQDEDDDNNINGKKEERDMKKEEVEALVAEAVKKAMGPEDEPETTEEEPVEKADDDEDEAPVTPESVEKMVEEAVAKALHPEGEEAILQEMVEKAVTEAVEPILKSHGLPTNLNGDSTGEIKKDESHYLHGIL